MAHRSIPRVAWILAPLLLMLGLGPVPSRAAALTMTAFTPHSGHVGTKVTITGTGFQTADIVSFNGVNAVVAKVNTARTKLTTSVPSFATSGPITVGDPTTGQVVGLPGTTFTVTRGVFASPNHVWAGGELTFAGSGLSPDQADPILIGTARVGLARTNANGDFQVGVAVPWNNPSGKTTISVVDTTYHKVHTVLYVLGDWPQYRHDTANSGLDNYETALSTTTVKKLKKDWSFPSGSIFNSSPVVADGKVFIGSADDNVYALNASTGVKDWSYTTGDFVLATPAVANGIVYVGSLDHDIYALDAATGTPAWTFATGGAVESSPDVVNGVVYIGSNDGEVYALDASTGAKLWSFQTGGAVNSSPAVVGGVVYVGSTDDNLYALDASTGSKIWSYDTQNYNTTSPTVSGGLVFFGNDGNLDAVHAATGTFDWSFPTGGIVLSSPAVANSVVYIGSDDDSLYAVDAAAGTKVWSFAAGDQIDPSPAIANGVVYIGSADGNAYALNASTGAKLASLATGGPMESSPTVANGMLYVATQGSSHAVIGFGI